MIGLGSKAAKIAKVAKKVADTKKSAIRKVFDELPEDVKSEMPYMDITERQKNVVQTNLFLT